MKKFCSKCGNNDDQEAIEKSILAGLTKATTEKWWDVFMMLPMIGFLIEYSKHDDLRIAATRLRRYRSAQRQAKRKRHAA